MWKIKVEIDEKYRESLDILKQVIPDVDWSQITDDWKILGVLIESFMSFLQAPGWECWCWEDCECWDDCQCEGDSDHNCEWCKH